MIRGIRWEDARIRLGAMTALPREATKPVEEVLRRELTDGTVEQITELLTPALRTLRDAYEIQAADGDCGATNEVRPKKSTVKGEARMKLIGALLEHHKYSQDELSQEPINGNALARQADVGKSTASRFLKSEFGGRDKYRRCCRDIETLRTALKLLAGDFSPNILIDPHRAALQSLESDPD